LELLQRTSQTTGRTVVIITHNQAFEAIADRVINVREGRVSSMEVNPSPANAAELVW
jgi:putative ABC transport system ATP-binding protein